MSHESEPPLTAGDTQLLRPLNSESYEQWFQRFVRASNEKSPEMRYEVAQIHEVIRSHLTQTYGGEKMRARWYIAQLTDAAAHWGVKFDLEGELNGLDFLSESERRELLEELRSTPSQYRF